MKIRLLSLFLLSFFYYSLKGQSGDYFLSHYLPTDERIDYRSLGMVQDSHGVIYFTTRNGVLEFDGHNWRLIPTPGAVYTLSYHKDVIYAGGLFGFGRLTQLNGGPPQFTLISDQGEIFASLLADDVVYFCNEANLFSFSITDNKLEKIISAPANDSFQNLLLISGKPFAVMEGSGLQKIESSKLVKSPFHLPSGEHVLFATTTSKKETIVGTDAGNLYPFSEGVVKRPVKLVDDNLLKRLGLVTGSLVTDSLLALGTLRGGVVFINPQTGATVETINYHNGLPDNDVFALLTDRNLGVWVAHEYGFTRIAPFLPFRSYNHYPGLEGNLLCVNAQNGTLYTGTTLGLFRLTKEVVESEVSVSETVKDNFDQDKGKKKFLNFLHKKKIKDPTVTKNKTVKHFFKYTRYVYQRVKDIESKVTQLLSVDGKLLAIGLDGAFEINGLTAKPIVKEPVRAVFKSPSLHQLFVGTYQERVKTFSFSEKSGWQETHLLDTLNDYVSHIFEDKLQNIWLCARSKIYKLELVDNEITDLVTLSINNPTLDETVGLAYGSDVYVAASGEFKRFDALKNQFVKYDSLPGPRKYFASAGYFWFYDGHKWRTVDRKIQTQKLEWLGLFPNLRFLAPDENNAGLWLITADNQLYRFSNSRGVAEDARYPLFLREIKGPSTFLRQEKSMKIDQPENTVSFEFIQPNYVGLQATEYRYQVKGLTKAWTSWSNLNNIIPFPYLAPGSYQLAVQSRDLLGNESKVELINFEVLPPYWKRWWFYLLEFLFFSFLVVVTVKLSGSNARYRTISRVLSLLTVIMLIQFIQTGVNSLIDFKSSPVVEFFIQVLIALIVLPIESNLRMFMQKASEGRYQIKLSRSEKTSED